MRSSQPAMSQIIRNGMSEYIPLSMVMSSEQVGEFTTCLRCLLTGQVVGNAKSQTEICNWYFLSSRVIDNLNMLTQMILFSQASHWAGSESRNQNVHIVADSMTKKLYWFKTNIVEKYNYLVSVSGRYPNYNATCV